MERADELKEIAEQALSSAHTWADRAEARTLARRDADLYGSYYDSGEGDTCAQIATAFAQISLAATALSSETRKRQYFADKDDKASSNGADKPKRVKG